jgi:hypothetical protein
MALGDAVAQAFADLFGATLAEGGAIAGGIFCAALFFAMVILSAKLEGGAAPAFGGLLIGAVISVMMGWFEMWVPLLAALLLAVILIKPFGSSSGV